MQEQENWACKLDKLVYDLKQSPYMQFDLDVVTDHAANMITLCTVVNSKMVLLSICSLYVVDILVELKVRN